MNKIEHIDAIRHKIHREMSYGNMDGIKLLVDAFTEMLLVLAEEPDYDEIARRMTTTFFNTPMPMPSGYNATIDPDAQIINASEWTSLANMEITTNLKEKQE